MIQKIEFQFLPFHKKIEKLNLYHVTSHLLLNVVQKFKIQQQESFALAPNYFDDIAPEM